MTVPQQPSPYDPQQGGAQNPYGAPQQPYGAQQHAYGAQPQGFPQSGLQHPQGGIPGQQGFPGPSQNYDVPPTGTPGVSAVRMTGIPVSDAEARQWAMLAQLGTLVTGFIAPLVVYLLYKDRNRFVRFHAAEALNLAITTFIAIFALSIVLSILTVITFGFGGILFPLAFTPGIYAFVVAIIGGIRANNGIWWPYPLNIRFLS